MPEEPTRKYRALAASCSYSPKPLTNPNQFHPNQFHPNQFTQTSSLNQWGRASALPPGFRPAQTTAKSVETIVLSRHYSCVNRYDRRLLHMNAIGGRIFVTFRLHGSLPKNRIFPPSTLTHGEAFVAMERLLDNPKSGPTCLSQPEIASMVAQSIIETETRFHRYELHAFVVMPNHVHLLVTSQTPLSKWLRSLKGYTGHEALRILNQSGKTFWQDESYDHIIRNDEEFANTRRYIEWNPVKAGLAASPAEFRWCSATNASSHK